MNTIPTEIYLFLKLLLLCSSQTLVPNNSGLIVLNYNRSLSISFFLNSTSLNELKCNLSKPHEFGYSDVSFNTPITSSSTFNVTVSPIISGRAIEFVCGIRNNLNIKLYLIVRPSVKAFICGTNTFVTSSNSNSPVSILIKFSYPLIEQSQISCNSPNGTSSTAIVKISSPNVLMNFTFSNFQFNIPISVNCNFRSPSSNHDFSGMIRFQNQTIHFFPKSITTNSQEIQLNLLINYNPPQEITFVCCILSISSIPLSCQSPNANIPWSLRGSQPVFRNNGDKSIVLTMFRTGPSPNNNESYTVFCSNDTISTFANVSILNNNIQILGTANGTEKVYNDLSFFQLATCPCDLTVDLCDANCCCDLFCNCTGVTPILGPFGGSFNDPKPRSCKYQDPFINSYQSLLCVENESPNIIGDYYKMKPILKNDSTVIAQEISSRPMGNGFQIMETNNPTSQSPLLISINANYISQKSSSQVLYLPKQDPNSGSCNLQSPIVLFQPYESTCAYNVTAVNCESLDDPRLNSLFYLLSTTLLETSCNDNIEIASISGNIPTFIFYKCLNSTNCYWDDGFARPPVPSNNNNLCQNVVQSVSYTIYYNNNTVSFISGTIELVNITLNQPVNQRFSVSFSNTNVTTSISSTMSFPALKETSKQIISNLSGLFGYDDGKPILTKNEVNSSSFTSIKSFSTSVSGLCNNNFTDVLFRYDNLAQCRFDVSNSVNCTDKSEQIKNYLDLLFNNKFVAIYGNPNSAEDYLEVNKLTSPNKDVINVTGTSSKPDMKIPLESMKYCTNIVTGLVTTIYYARQGKSMNQYINNIVGVAKRYEVNNVSSFSGFGINNNQSNYITLTSYVEFRLVAADISGPKNTDDNNQVVCNFDICLNELFYPWMYSYEGKQGFYEETFGLFLLGLAIFLLATTFPWW